MIKYLIFPLLCLTMSTIAVAQKPLAAYYLTSSGFSVSTKDSADFILTILPPDSTTDKDLFIIKNYYTNGKIRYLGGTKVAGLHSTDPDFLRFLAPTLEGSFMSFFPNGHKMRIGNYENGEAVGDETEYYPNGKLYCTKTYSKDKKILCNECRDSTGNVLVENGNGKWLAFADEKFKSYLIGDVADGLQQGEWHGKIDDTTNSFGIFKNGELSSMGVFDESGQKIYTKVDLNPEFPGGIDKFYKFLGKTVRYPANAREQHKQGRVVVSVTVNEDGSLSNFKVVKSAGRDLDEETIRVFKLSPQWKAGMVDGKPVKVIYSIPLNFTLSNDN